MKNRIIFFLSLVFIGVGTCLASIEIPISPDDNGTSYNNRHRSRPIQHWCSIDLENSSICSSIEDIVWYELIGADEITLISTPVPSILIDQINAIPDGQYTIRLITSDKTYSGIIHMSRNQQST